MTDLKHIYGCVNIDNDAVRCVIIKELLRFYPKCTLDIRLAIPGASSRHDAASDMFRTKYSCNKIKSTYW
jgi:hypothetical protein